MKNSSRPDQPEPTTGKPFLTANNKILTISLAFLTLALSTWIAAASILRPPRAVPANAPADQFSGERAMGYLRTIASEPHTVGSPAQERLRDYLLEQIRALGIEPVLQQTTAALPNRKGIFASNLTNILVRLPGSDSTGAVAIMAHYDSQPNTSGASDNGAAAAGMLETLRVLRADVPMRNDLIFIFTDAEEVDAQGASAFFWQHPWTKDIRLLVNFEAAGNSGASLLMETSPGNRGLAEGYIQAVPHPVAYSFMTQLLTVMPIGTDMTVFAENGIPSLSPMFGWGYHVMYHSELDNVEAIDTGSVQHQGENGLGLAHYFGNLDLGSLNTSEDQIFFTLFPGLTIQYPAGWAVPLAVFAGVSLIGVILYGLIRRRLSVPGILGGTGAALSMILVPLILDGLAWMLISRLNPQFWRNLMGSPYRAETYLFGLAALTAAGSSALFLLIRQKLSLLHLTIGMSLVWLALAGLTSFGLPGMSYLFTWPVFFESLAAAVLLSIPAEQASFKRLAVTLLAGAANVLLIVPIVVLLYMLIGFWFLTINPSAPFILVTLLFLACLLGLLSPLMDLLTSKRKWITPAAAGFLAVIVLTAASLMSNPSPAQPMQNGVWYHLNADSQAATWSSFGERPADPWTAQFFPGEIERIDPASIYPMLSGSPTPAAAFRGPAPLASLAVPELTVVSDRTEGNVRRLALHLTSPRNARGLMVQVSGTAMLAASINGNRQTFEDWPGLPVWTLRYYGMNEKGLDLRLEIRPSTEVVLVVTDQSDGLPALAGVSYTPRRADMMPFAMAQEYMPYPETTSVSKTYRIP